MPGTGPPGAFELDPTFISRVFRTAVVVTALGALVFCERFGLPAALGWTLGALVNLGSLRALEWTVRGFTTSGRASPTLLAALSMLKLLVIIGILAGAFVAARAGRLSLIWVVPGFMMPHLVIVLKIVGLKLIEATRKPIA
jgi:hypothetical protein